MFANRKCVKKKEGSFMKNIKIVNMKKFIRSIIIVFGIVIAIIFFGTKETLSHNEKEQINYESIYVTQGDTLWNIATDQQKTNPYYQNKDVRFVVSEIRKINNLSNANLKIGQELRIPVI